MADAHIFVTHLFFLSHIKYKKKRNKPDRGFCSGPARFVEHCSGVKHNEREDGNDVNVELEREGKREGGREAVRERERGAEFVRLRLQHHS